MLPSYAMFSVEEAWGNTTVLRSSLDAAWDYVLTGQKDESRFGFLLSQCDDITPTPHEFESDLASAALDAANATTATLLCCLDGDAARGVEVAEYARDTIDMYLQIRGDIDPDDPEIEDRIAMHPLMQKEVNRQLNEIILLQSAESPAVVFQRLRNSQPSLLS